MSKVLSALDADVVDLPPRPLTFTDGQGDGKKTTSDPEVPTEDPVCDWATEPALLQPTEVPQDQVTDVVTQAEEKIQKLVVSSTKLEDRVKELEELLCEARNECEREREAHFILQSEYDEMKENLMDKKQLLKVSLAEDEKKHQKTVETIAQLEVENSDLKDQVETLQGRVQNMENLLHETYRWSADQMNECEREREAYVILQSEYDEMKENLMDKEQLLKVSQSEDEQKPQKAVETIAQLVMEKSDLIDQVERLRLRVWEMENLHHETYRWSADQMNECEREWEAHVILQSEYDELKENLVSSLIQGDNKY